MADIIKKRLKAAEYLFSIALSRVMQPIEAILIGCQMGCKIRSAKGLIIHAFGRLVAVFITLKIYPLIHINNKNHIKYVNLHLVTVK